jgi:hypothetical protein
MVFATKENYKNINRGVELTCLSREQVVQAMSKERKRFKAQRTTVEELNPERYEINPTKWASCCLALAVCQGRR